MTTRARQFTLRLSDVESLQGSNASRTAGLSSAQRSPRIRGSAPKNPDGQQSSGYSAWILLHNFLEKDYNPIKDTVSRVQWESTPWEPDGQTTPDLSIGQRRRYPFECLGDCMRRAAPGPGPGHRGHAIGEDRSSLGSGLRVSSNKPLEGHTTVEFSTRAA